MSSNMAKLNIDLPPHCQVKDRGAYKDVYFTVHPKDRPDGWAATIKLGRTDKKTPEEIGDFAQETYENFLLFKAGVTKRENEAGTLGDVIEIYKKSSLYKDLALKTRSDYSRYLNEVRKWSKKNGDPHIKFLDAPAIIKFLNTFETTPVKQRHMKYVLKTLCSVAYMEGYIKSNPVNKDIKTRKRQTKKRDVVIWTEEDIDAFVTECDARGLHSLGSIALTMIETAQRKGDVINMRSNVSYKEGKLAYIQSKTGKTVWLDATDKLKSRYAKYPSNDFYMFVHENTGKKWGEYNVTHTARKILDSIGLNDHILMELRHSQVNYLFEHGMEDSTITAMTGHEKPETMRQYYREKRNQELANKGVAMINEERKKRKSHTK